MGQKQYPLINNFSAGELSSRVEGRVDTKGYYDGCKTLRNAIIVAQGGVEKRPGTIYIHDAYNTSSKTRLIPFEIDDDNVFILELSNNHIRVWDALNETIKQDFTSGYPEDDLADLQIAQVEDRLYFAHINHRVAYLHFDGTNFDFNTMSFNVQDYNSSVAYKYGDYVYDASSNGYYRAKKDNTGVAPTLYDWTDGTEPLAQTPTGDINTYAGGAITAGNIVLYNKKIWYANKSYSSDCYPGIGVVTADTDVGPVRSEWVRVKDLGIPWYRYPGSAPDYMAYIRNKYETSTSKVVFENSFTVSILVFGAWVRFHIETTTNVSSEEGDDPYWTQIGTLPVGSSASIVKKHVASSGTSYVVGDVVWFSTDVRLYECLKATTADPGTSSTWEDVSGNPFFSKDGDYPAAIGFANQRLYLAGTKTRPQTIFASKVGRYDDFNTGTDDDDAFYFTIASSRLSRIKWLEAKDQLMIGTETDEWMVVGNTPTNVQVLRQSAYGSAYSQAHFVGDALLFYQKGGRKLREYVYSNDNKAYQANDLTFTADHITYSKIRESAYQQNPDNIYWNVRNDGVLVGLTYDRLHGIMGWHRHQTSGAFESICVVSSDTDEDSIWFVVRREINGTFVRYLEKLAPRFDYNRQYLIFSDSAVVHVEGSAFTATSIAWGDPTSTVTYDNVTDPANGDLIQIQGTDDPVLDYQLFTITNLNTTAKTFDLLDEYGAVWTPADFGTKSGIFKKVTYTVTGLDHLDGMEVSILGDDAVYPNQTVGAVTGGIGVTLDNACNTIVVGLPYTMKLEPESIEIPGANTLGASRRISKATLSLYQTLGGWVGSDEEHMQELRFRDTTVPFGVAPELFTGIKDIPIDSSVRKQNSILIIHDQPLPMTILAIITDITYTRG